MDSWDLNVINYNTLSPVLNSSARPSKPCAEDPPAEVFLARLETKLSVHICYERHFVWALRFYGDHYLMDTTGSN